MPITKLRPTPAKASVDLLYRAQLGPVAFIDRLYQGLTVADCRDQWLETMFRSKHIFGITIAAGATYSGAFEGTLDEVTWYPLVPEAGSTTTANPITQASAPGFWLFTGAWKYMRFNASAMGVAATTIAFSTRRD